MTVVGLRADHWGGWNSRFTDCGEVAVTFEQFQLVIVGISLLEQQLSLNIFKFHLA